MKLIKSLPAALSLCIILLTHSCNPDDSENRLPELKLESEDQVKQAVDSVYNILYSDALYKYALYYSMDFMSLEQMNTVDPIFDIFMKYSFNSQNTYIKDYWDKCYAGIRQANMVINNQELINKIPQSIFSQQQKDKYIGEAQFLRAFYYFLLITRFGDVPLDVDYPSETGLDRTPKSEIWAQIETDLVSAAEKCLPKNLEEKGRATSGAAWALLGKAYLFQANESGSQADYAEAKNAFLQVIDDAANYKLEEIYSDNFKEETENGNESIFEVDLDASQNKGSYRSWTYGCMNYYDAYPSLDLVNEFETIADNGVKDDPRLGYCIYQTGDLYNNGTDTVVFSNDTLWTWVNDQRVVNKVIYRCGWKKYQSYYKQKSEQMLSSINMKVIRLADVLLMMAEVENELGHLTEAVDYLNMIRNRADVMMPNYGTPAMDIIYPVTNKEQIRKAIEHERKVELCNEQVRINDLFRWRRMEAFYEEAKPSFPPWAEDEMNFDPAFHYLWPIPQSAIDLNPALTQNPGY